MLRTLICAITTVIVFGWLGISSASSQNRTTEKKDAPQKKGTVENMKWDTKDFESAIQTELGLKMKSVTQLRGNPKAQEPDRVKFLLEFENDGDPEKVKTSLNQRRVGIVYGPDRAAAVAYVEPCFEILFYDQENVRIGKTSGNTFDGDITGRKGETFRLYVRINDPRFLPDTKRIEVKLHPRLDIQHDKQSAELTKAVKWDTGELQKPLESEYGLKLKTVSLVSVGKDRHIMLDCERTRANVKPLFNLVGPPFKSGGLECHFYAADDSVVEVTKSTPEDRVYCYDDFGKFGQQSVGDRVTLFLRPPQRAVWTKATKAILRIAAQEK